MRACAAVILVLAAFPRANAGEVSPLGARGYTVLPYPQKVQLEGADFQFGPGWGIAMGAGVQSDAIAFITLREQMEDRFSLPLDGGSKHVRLELKAGAIVPGAAQDRHPEAIAAQAYRLEIHASGIRITANSSAGLLYAVETLVQLVKREKGGFWLPEARIEDWPDLQLRTIYWDDAHHLDRMDVLKGAIRQAAFFKANGFALKL